MKKPINTAKPQKFRKNAKRQNAKIFFCGLCGITTKTQRYYFVILRLRLCGFLRLCAVKEGVFNTLKLKNYFLITDVTDERHAPLDMKLSNGAGMQTDIFIHDIR